MICGCLPFDDESEDELYSKITKGDYCFRKSSNISIELADLIIGLLK